MAIALPYFSQPLVNMPLGLAHSHRQVGILQFESLQPASKKEIGLVNTVYNFFTTKALLPNSTPLPGPP